MPYFLYILASHKNGTLYVGVTNNLVRRLYEHKERLIYGFTNKYGVKLLVYYEVYTNSLDAIMREKQIKKWRRYWKIKLIEKHNKEWEDLYIKIKG